MVTAGLVEVSPWPGEVAGAPSAPALTSLSSRPRRPKEAKYFTKSKRVIKGEQPSVTILQSLPGAWVPPHQPGHMKEDLLSLMMLQNIQIHQLLMSRLTMSALDAKLLTSQVNMPSLQDDGEEEEEEILVFHHHYVPFSAPAPVPLLPCLVPDPRQSWLPEISEIRNLPRDSQIIPSARRGVPPPPPPSATGTVGADVPPASDYYDVAEGQL